MPKFASFATYSSVGLATSNPIPSTLIFNAGGEFESRRKNVAILVVEPFSFSEGPAFGSAVHVFSGRSTKKTTNKFHLSSSTGEMGAIPTTWETPQCEGKSSSKDRFWLAMGSLYSCLNNIFEFCANN